VAQADGPDQQYHMTVPGFDALVAKITHLPTDNEDRKRLRTVIPRTVRRAEEPVLLGPAPAVVSAAVKRETEGS
jgi:hypothetical protein